MDLVFTSEVLKTLEREEREEINRHSLEMRRIVTQRNDTLKNQELLLAGLDTSKIETAERLLQFEGDPRFPVHGDYRDQMRPNTRRDAIQDAIKQLATVAMPFEKTYVVVKNYASFGDQREDHEYRYGPKHGHIVFKIGRRREDDVFHKEYTREERDACIYFLLKWSDICAAREKIKTCPVCRGPAHPGAHCKALEAHDNGPTLRHISEHP